MLSCISLPASFPTQPSKLRKTGPTDYRSTNSCLLHRLGTTKDDFEHPSSTPPLIVLTPKPGITRLAWRQRPRASNPNRASEGGALLDIARNLSERITMKKSPKLDFSDRQLKQLDALGKKIRECNRMAFRQLRQSAYRGASERQ